MIAPYKVKLWMGRNGDGLAEWSRIAKGVQVDWQAVKELLGGAGWGAWRAHAFDIRRPPERSGHYESALVRLIARALQSPGDFQSRPLFELVEEAFDNPPDAAEIKRLAKAIRVSLAADPEAPS